MGTKGTIMGYTAKDVKKAKGAAFRGSYSVGERRFIVDAYDNVFESWPISGIRTFVGKLNGRSPRVAIADILNTEE